MTGLFLLLELGDFCLVVKLYCETTRDWISAWSGTVGRTENWRMAPVKRVGEVEYGTW